MEIIVTDSKSIEQIRIKRKIVSDKFLSNIITGIILITLGGCVYYIIKFIMGIME